MAKVSVSTPAFSATARVFTRPSCTFHSSSFPQGAARPKQAVKEAVSLRDLAATIVDVVGQEAGSPFPGVSLARFWKRPRPVAPIQPPSALPALAEVVPHDLRNRDYWGVPRTTLSTGSRQGKRLVVHPPRGRRPRGVVPLERRRQGAAQPGRRSIRPDDPGADASSAGPPDRGASLARAIQSLMPPRRQTPPALISIPAWFKITIPRVTRAGWLGSSWQ